MKVLLISEAQTTFDTYYNSKAPKIKSPDVKTRHTLKTSQSQFPNTYHFYTESMRLKAVLNAVKEADLKHSQ